MCRSTSATARCGRPPPTLADEYPGLLVHAVVGDFHLHIDRVPSEGRRLVAFLGSTIGNLTPDQRSRFLFDLDCMMAHGDRLLLGTDLVKDRSRLLAAYDDSQGVTAAFNRNVLHVLNRELHASFDPDRFEHVALWNEEAKRIEMRLRSLSDQVVSIADLSIDVTFAAGEDLLTEISSKFTRQGVEDELYAAGFLVDSHVGGTRRRLPPDPGAALLLRSPGEGPRADPVTTLGGRRASSRARRLRPRRACARGTPRWGRHGRGSPGFARRPARRPGARRSRARPSRTTPRRPRWSDCRGPWPSALAPQSATAQPEETDTTVASTVRAWPKGNESFP